MTDLKNVNHPTHYTVGGVEAIDVMQAKSSTEEFLGYCVNNALKYLLRRNYKHKYLEDILKASWYLQRASSMILEADTERASDPCEHCVDEGDYIRLCAGCCGAYNEDSSD